MDDRNDFDVEADETIGEDDLELFEDELDELSELDELASEDTFEEDALKEVDGGV